MADELDQKWSEYHKKEERLGTLLAILGYGSVDEFHDYICTHGAVKLVPIDRAPVEETQSQFPSTEKQQKERYHNRKHDLATAHEQVKRLETDLSRLETSFKEREIRFGCTIDAKQQEALIATLHVDTLRDDYSSLWSLYDTTRKELQIAIQELTNWQRVQSDSNNIIATLEQSIVLTGEELEGERLSHEEAKMDIVTLEEECRTIKAEGDTLQQQITLLTARLALVSARNTPGHFSPAGPTVQSFGLQVLASSRSGNVSPRRSTLTSNRPPMSTISLATPRPPHPPLGHSTITSSLPTPIATPAWSTRLAPPTMQYSCPLPSLSDTAQLSPSQPPPSRSNQANKVARNVQLKHYTKLIDEYATTKEKLFIARQYNLSSISHWCKEQGVIIPGSGPGSIPSGLPTEYDHVFPPIDSILASDEKAEELAQLFISARESVVIARKLYEDQKAWRGQMQKRLSKISEQKLQFLNTPGAITINRKIVGTPISSNKSQRPVVPLEENLVTVQRLSSPTQSSSPPTMASPAIVATSVAPETESQKISRAAQLLLSDEVGSQGNSLDLDQTPPASHKIFEDLWPDSTNARRTRADDPTATHSISRESDTSMTISGVGRGIQSSGTEPDTEEDLPIVVIPWQGSEVNRSAALPTPYQLFIPPPHISQRRNFIRDEASSSVGDDKRFDSKSSDDEDDENMRESQKREREALLDGFESDSERQSKRPRRVACDEENEAVGNRTLTDAEVEAAAEEQRRMIKEIQANRKAENAWKALNRTVQPRRIEINPKRNEGYNFHYKETDRTKAGREKMVGIVCPGCTEYWERARITDPSKMTCGHNVKEAQGALVSANSRHKVQSMPAATPVNFWPIGMESTQQVEQINAQAQLRRQQMRELKEAEAKKHNGRYQYAK